MTPADANIFEDLGFPPAEAAQMLLQADLAISVRQIIQTRKLTRARAAKIFGVSQARINELLKDDLDYFTIDVLVKMLTRAGVEVELTIKNRAA